MRRRWSRGSGGRYIMFSVLLLSLKNNIYQSGNFLVNPSEHPQKTYADTSRIHVKMHQVQTVIQNLLAGRHCTSEYIMHMYHFCSRINGVYITGRTTVFYSVYAARGGLLCDKTQRRSSISQILLQIIQCVVQQ